MNRFDGFFNMKVMYYRLPRKIVDFCEASMQGKLIFMCAVRTL